MADMHRGMMFKNQSNQFVKSNQFHHHGGQTRPLQNVPPRNAIPIPRFNPGVPPPGFNVASFPPHGSQSVSTSNNFLRPPENFHVPLPPFTSHGTVGPRTGYQKPPCNPPFQPRCSAPFPFLPPPISPLPVSSPASSRTANQQSQEMLDKSWLKQWLEQHQIKPSVKVAKETIKIGEARKLFHQWSSLNEQLKNSRDELIQKIDLPNNEWNECLARTTEMKNELLSIQQVLSDPVVINNIQEKICERKRKRLWSKNKMKRRYLEKLEDGKRRERLHNEIDEWQKEKIEKDVAARKEASLKHEAGGVLGEVRRKRHDGRKLLELLNSILKLREIRKSEGQKKGVYPKTSSEDDRKFTGKAEYIERLLSKRVESYEAEEKALRVMMVEEEEEKEKKQEKERLEQKALLNLSKECDPLADFRRYYGQAEERIEYLIQIRREWDAYLAPENAFGASRIPDGEIRPSRPSNDVWSAVLENSGTDVR